jgi:hypothetical protein
MASFLSALLSTASTRARLQDGGKKHRSWQDDAALPNKHLAKAEWKRCVGMCTNAACQRSLHAAAVDVRRN